MKNSQRKKPLKSGKILFPTMLEIKTHAQFFVNLILATALTNYTICYTLELADTM